jgi:hypothetical protein
MLWNLYHYVARVSAHLADRAKRLGGQAALNVALRKKQRQLAALIGGTHGLEEDYDCERSERATTSMEAAAVAHSMAGAAAAADKEAWEAAEEEEEGESSESSESSDGEDDASDADREVSGAEERGAHHDAPGRSDIVMSGEAGGEEARVQDEAAALWAQFESQNARRS